MGDVPAPPHRRSEHASHTRGCDWEAAADTPEGTGNSPERAAIDRLVKRLGRACPLFRGHALAPKFIVLGGAPLKIDLQPGGSVDELGPNAGRIELAPLP